MAPYGAACQHTDLRSIETLRASGMPKFTRLMCGLGACSQAERANYALGSRLWSPPGPPALGGPVPRMESRLRSRPLRGLCRVGVFRCAGAVCAAVPARPVAACTASGPRTGRACRYVAARPSSAVVAPAAPRTQRWRRGAMKFYLTSADDALRELGCDATRGLAPGEVRASAKLHGANELTREKPEPHQRQRHGEGAPRG